MKEEMKMPGFTAEASLYKANKHFGMVSLPDAGTDGQNVQPQSLGILYTILTSELGRYAGCYWSCIAGGGDWVGCRDECKRK